jgi:hypothetical protein
MPDSRVDPVVDALTTLALIPGGSDWPPVSALMRLRWSGRSAVRWIDPQRAWCSGPTSAAASSAPGRTTSGRHAFVVVATGSVQDGDVGVDGRTPTTARW